VGDNPFFDRKDLRPMAQELVDQAARPLLRVNGDDGFGRSYTSRFFDFLSHEKGEALHVAIARLEKDQGPSYNVDELAAELVSSMGISEVPKPSGSSYPAALKRFVLASALARPGRWVFVLEGFDQPDVEPDVREFIHLLTKAVCDGDPRKRARVVLIDYRSPIPSVIKGDVLEEVLVAPSKLKSEDVVRCLEALDKKRREQGRSAWDVGGLDDVAAGILADAPAEGKGRLQHVYDSLIKLRDAA